MDSLRSLRLNLDTLPESLSELEALAYDQLIDEFIFQVHSINLSRWCQWFHYTRCRQGLNLGKNIDIREENFVAFAFLKLHFPLARVPSQSLQQLSSVANNQDDSKSNPVT